MPFGEKVAIVCPGEAETNAMVTQNKIGSHQYFRRWQHVGLADETAVFHDT